MIPTTLYLFVRLRLCVTGELGCCRGELGRGELGSGDGVGELAAGANRMEGAGGEPPPQRTRSRQELLRERRRGGGGDGGSAGGSSPPSSRHGEGSASPSGSPLTHDEEAKETASRIHSLLERSCSSDAQRQRVFAAGRCASVRAVLLRRRPRTRPALLRRQPRRGLVRFLALLPTRNL